MPLIAGSQEQFSDVSACGVKYSGKNLRRRNREAKIARKVNLAIDLGLVIGLVKCVERRLSAPFAYIERLTERLSLPGRKRGHSVPLAREGCFSERPSCADRASVPEIDRGRHR
jgi:hypothetical protein